MFVHIQYYLGFKGKEIISFVTTQAKPSVDIILSKINPGQRVKYLLIDPQATRRDRLWDWLGFLKFQSPCLGTYFLLPHHTHYNNATPFKPSK